MCFCVFACKRFAFVRWNSRNPQLTQPQPTADSASNVKAVPTSTIATDQAFSASPTTLIATTATNTTAGTTTGATTTEAATTLAAATAANTTGGTTAGATTTEAATTLAATTAANGSRIAIDCVTIQFLELCGHI